MKAISIRTEQEVTERGASGPLEAGWLSNMAEVLVLGPLFLFGKC